MLFLLQNDIQYLLVVPMVPSRITSTTASRSLPVFIRTVSPIRIWPTGSVTRCPSCNPSGTCLKKTSRMRNRLFRDVHLITYDELEKPGAEHGPDIYQASMLVLTFPQVRFKC
jgi:hypothetical protein